MTIADYEKLVEGKTCRFHNKPMPLPSKIDHYAHAGGYTVEGFDMKQWLSVHCDACGYDWSISKLGIPREGE